MKNSAFLFLILLIILSGCITSSTPYQNDVIVQENYVLTRANPFTDSTTTIRFNLRNLGRDVVPRTIVDFFDLQGMGVDSLQCQNGYKISDHSCQFTNIDSLDTRLVSITLHTPSSDIIKSPTSFQISYKISFDYSGFRRIAIPVIDDSQESQPQNKYSISDPSTGPIEVAFEPPIGAITKQGNQQVTEYWGIKGDSFDIRMDFKQAVQSAIPTNISAGNIKLNLQGLTINQHSKCDFNSGLTANSDITVGNDQVSLSCSFTPQPFSKAETMTVIDVNYAYTFETIKSETFTVYPTQTSTGNSGNPVGTPV